MKISRQNAYEIFEETIHKVSGFFRTSYRRIKRLIDWFPVIWRDEDWDSAYLFEIMRFKISCIRKEIEKNQRHVGCERDIHNMKIAEELLRRNALSNFYWDLSQQREDREQLGKNVCPLKKNGFLSQILLILKQKSLVSIGFWILPVPIVKNGNRTGSSDKISKKKKILSFYFII